MNHLPVETDLKPPQPAGLRDHPLLISGILGMTIIFLAIFALFVGKNPISPGQVIEILGGIWNGSTDLQSGASQSVLFIRFPRIIAALLVGAGLAVAGAVLQGIFNNPLVSPQFLGISSGAAWGVAIAILMNANPGVTSVAAFACGLSAIVVALLLSRLYRSTMIYGLVLAGIIVGALFQSLTALIKYLADPADKLPSIIFWMAGSFNHVNPESLPILGVILIIPLILLIMLRWQINLLSLGEDPAKTLGLPSRFLYVLILVLSTLMVASSVVIAGPIGWVGLVIPNIIRQISGPDHIWLVPQSALLGGAYLLLIDTIARTVGQTEIPVGILTALIGTPVFIWLLRTHKAGVRR